MATRVPQSRSSKTPIAKKSVASKAPAKKRAATKPKTSTNSAVAATGRVSDEGNQSAKAKHKLVRDSFTMPRDEYSVIGELKMRLAKLEQLSKKSELLRAGIKMLASLSDAALLHAMRAVPSIKTGRPNRGP